MDKIRHNKKRLAFTVLGLGLIAAGIYGLITIYSPALVVDRFDSGSISTAQQQLEKPIDKNRLIIPEIGTNMEFLPGDESILLDNIWHRYPERGDPVKGGNFILSGHRLRVGFTPGQTIRQSPLYNIDRLQVGDKITVHYEGKAYRYEISKIYRVEPTAVEIEAPSDTHKLTLYSCTLKGAHDGREVIEALPVERVAGGL